MLGDGPRCRQLGDEFLSAYWSDATTGNISDTILEEEEEKLPAGGAPQTCTLRKQVVVE